MAKEAYAVMLLVQQLRYKPQGCGFFSRRRSLAFPINLIILAYA
jgi:hypothetical protein